MAITYITRIDENRRAEHSSQNMIQSAVLVGAMGLVMCTGAALLWGIWGAVLALVVIGLGFVFSPRIPASAVMRLYRAREPEERHAGQLFHLMEALANRAELPAVPRLYVIPSKTLNAFAAGRPDDAAIAVTEGLLRSLDLREIAGVLAHEMSHIRNRDLRVMGIADMISRLTQFMSLFAIVLFVLLVPSVFAGNVRIPWLALGLLFAAPTISSFLQLGLSRVREFDADLEAVYLTGDPEGLAMALAKLERHTGRFWEDFLPTGRRVPQPSLLRSHPKTATRIERLGEVTNTEAFPLRHRLPRVALRDTPMVTSIGLGPIEMRPRYRLPGLWF